MCVACVGWCRARAGRVRRVHNEAGSGREKTNIRRLVPRAAGMKAVPLTEIC